MYRFKPRDLNVVLLSAYFVVGYAVKIDQIEGLLPGAQFIPLGILIVGGGNLFIRSIARKPFGLFPVRLRLFYVYIAVSLVLLVAVNLNALRPTYSIFRVIVSVGILALSIIFFWQALQVIETTKMRRGRLLTYSLLTLLIILLLGQLTIPEWATGIGGIRMSGGSNPNQLAFLAFFAIFWAHYSTLKKRAWERAEVYLYVVSLVVLAWSLSRSVILTWISLYFIYFAIAGVLHFAHLLRGRVRLSVLRKIVATGVFCLLLVPAIPTLEKTVYILQDFQKIEQRLSGESGLQSRIRAWKDIWPYFTEFPITGRAGWWNSTNVNSRVGGRMTATSPHNLFVRLLSESGIIGLILVLLLPFTVMIMLFLRLLSQRLSSNKFFVLLFAMASLISVLVGQLFEDRYMVGVGGIDSGIIYFILVCAINEILKKE